MSRDQDKHGERICCISAVVFVRKNPSVTVLDAASAKLNGFIIYMQGEEYSTRNGKGNVNCDKNSD